MNTGYLDYDAYVTPATSVMLSGTSTEDSAYMSYTLTHFLVNDVDIIDQITVTKQQ